MRVKYQDGTVPDVICHGGGELSESTHGDGGTDGQRPDSNTPETNDTSAEELSSQATPQGEVPVTDEDQSDGSSGEGAEENPVGEGPPEPEFIGGAVAFKTSGTFFRDRVAQTLAEQGFELEDVPSSELSAEDGDTSTPSSETDGSSTRSADLGKEAEDTEVADTAPDSEPNADDADFSGDGTDSSAGSSEPPVTGSVSEEGAEDEEERTESVASAQGTAKDGEAEEGSDPDSEATGVFPLPNIDRDPEEARDSENTDSPAGSAGVDSPVAAAEAATGPRTKPFEASRDEADEAAEPDEAAQESSPTEAMPAPSADAVPFDAPAPEEESQEAGQGSHGPTTDSVDEPSVEPDSTSSSVDAASTSSDDTMWPRAQRMSDYVSDRTEEGEASDSGTEGTTAATAAGAAAAAPAVARVASGGASPDTATGPGGPKGPPGGPGGPKGPGGKDGKERKKPKKPLWWRILRVLLITMGVMIITGAGVFAYFYSTVEIPDAAKADAVEQGSTFYYADGETEFAYRGTDREVIDYEQMVAGGDQVVEAVISAEDRGFWTEPGVSVSGTMRAVWSTLSGEQVQGGSTVTQQMVRNYYEGVSLEQTVARKVQEIIIAIKVDQSEDKEWVMEQYLNTIYFGRQAYGVQAAAQAYYHKDVQELTAEEAAFLAAAIQQPTRFGQADVETTPAMENRWQYVIDGMVTTGAITQAEADQMEFPAPEPEKPMEGADISGYKGYMLQEAVSELEDLGFTEDHVNRQGYKIVTTFDKDMMDAAYETVEEMVPQESLPEGVNIGLSTIDPATGEVLAFYGGHDYTTNQYDSSFRGAAQAGSAFKPYVLATALEQGYGLNSTVDGRGPRQIQGSRVQNAGNSPGGVMNLTQATRVSNNLGFVELAQTVGFEEIRQTAYDVGLPEGSIDDDQLVPVMPLGATSVRPIDQASGYATFANGGVHMQAHVVKEVVNQEGENERPEVEGKRALEESTASDVTYALEQVVTGGTGTAARLWDHPVAGKTGTTDGSVAAWFVGYTPQLSTAVGVYSGNNESFSIPGHNISGGGLPATMWNRYMSRAMEGYERESFPGPEFGGTTENWAPDPATQEPQEPVEPPEPEEPVEPEQPVEPEIPVEPELPEEPGWPDEPEDPGWPGEPEQPGIPEIPPPGRTEDARTTAP